VDGITDAAGIPDVTYMGLGYPNPFRERLTVRFGLHSSGSVEVRIYDVQGRLVRELVDESIQAGHKHVVWDGRDNSGRHAATGMYFVRMRTPEKTFKQTIRLIR
jgi:flagellar hook assembly protein FlgD